MSNPVSDGSVQYGPRLIYIYLRDGRHWHVPRQYTTKLAWASNVELRSWEFVREHGAVIGVRWPKIDEDILLSSLTRDGFQKAGLLQ
jgi:Protein of unknown function (DUF3532).